MAGTSAEVEAYIAAAPPQARPILEEIRRQVKQALPEATETISYQLPALRLERVFFYYAAFKAHIGVYPPLDAGHPLRAELVPFANEKGNLRFPYKDGVPVELIVRVAVALAEQYRG